MTTTEHVELMAQAIRSELRSNPTGGVSSYDRPANRRLTTAAADILGETLNEAGEGSEQVADLLELAWELVWDTEEEEQ